MIPTSQVLPLIALEDPFVETNTTVRASAHAESETPTNGPVWTFGSHCAELDGVRGVAILLVTLYRFIKEWDPASHWTIAFARNYCEIGQRGVDLFFVLSGFLITGILLHTKTSENYFRNFMVRRALRIFPLYFVALMVCLFVLPRLVATDAFDLPRSHQAYLWTYSSNIYMSWTNSWCFGPLDHFWSLAVEEHFYLVWPAIVLLLSPKNLLRATIVLAVSVGVVRAVAALRPELAVAVDTLTVLRCDSLALGAMLAVVLWIGGPSPRPRRIARLALPILIATGVLVALSGKRWMGLPHTLFGCLWTAVMAIVVTGTRGDLLNRCLRTPWLQWLGRYSYGMYVVQLPLVCLLPLSMFAPYLQSQGLHPLLSSVGYVAMLLAMTCGIAVVSFHCLEKPFLQLKRLFH